MPRPVEPAPRPSTLAGTWVLLVSLSLVLLFPASTEGHNALPGKHPVAVVQQTPVLEPNKPIERELSGGETHAYSLTVAAGQYVAVDVLQQRINVTVSAFAPDGQKLIEADQTEAGDIEEISFTTESTKTYRIEVYAQPSAPKGSYEIKVNEVRAARADDNTLITLQRLLAEAGQLRRPQTTESSNKAILRYQEAATLAHEVKDPVWEATALYLICSTYIALGEKQKALDVGNQALAVAQAAVNESAAERRPVAIKIQAFAIETMGMVHNQFGDKKKAVELFLQSLALRRGINDRVGEMGELNSIGMAYGYMGEHRQALEYFEQAQKIADELGNQITGAIVLNNLCVVQSNVGEYKKAIVSCNQAIAIRRSLNDRLGVAIALDNIGTIHSSLGEYQEALNSHNESLATYRELGNKNGQGVSLHNIAWVYGTLGENQKSIDLYTQAIDIFHAQGDQYREAFSLSNVGVQYEKLGDYQKALDIYLRILPIRISVNDREGIANTSANIANCYRQLGNREQALDYYNRALTILRSKGKPRLLALTLVGLGEFYRKSGELEQAMAYFTEGLKVSRDIGERNAEATILANIARLERDRGNLAAARSRVEEALAAIESLRVNVKNYQLRTSFFATVREYHELYIDVLMSLHQASPTAGFDQAALSASERGRARSLLELLSEANAEIKEGVDKSLLERERILRQTISAKADSQVRLLGGDYKEDQATAVARELDSLTTEYEQVQAKIRQTSPRYAALTQPQPLSLTDIQGQLLDDQTVLLEYSLGKERSFAWAVTSTGVKSFVLPKQADIELAARKVREAITTDENESTGQRRQLEKVDDEYSATAAALSRILLTPVASELGNKRLLIVADGVLQYVPFAALPDPATEAQATPLIVNHEIVSLPSASVMGVIRRETAGRQHAPKAVAVFGDPVFDAKDSRIAQAKNGTSVNQVPVVSAEVTRSAEDSGVNGFPRLRFSRQEAEQIVRLVPKHDSLAALDFAANRKTATDPELQQYRVVHFATHGLINSRHAELSGIVLSLVNEQGEPQNGYLRLYDIYNLRLKADLVVISACQTALGKDIKGEGLVGLTRAFMYAGAPRVIASLWRTEDRATSSLMNRFYEGLLTNGLAPASALRNAQISMWKDKRWHQPRYWAAFTIQGEWK